MADQCADLTRSHIKSLILDGCVFVNDAQVQEPDYKVKEGESITIEVPEPVIADPVAQNLPLSIIYEDDHLVVIDKAAGMVVHPAYGNPEGTLVNALLYHFGEGLSGIRGVKMPGIVHRLDKDTSGLMVIAKSDKAHQGLSTQFQNRTLFRRYLAIVWNLPSPPEGDIKGNIGRHPGNRQKMALVKYGGKEALTHYKIKEAYGTVASLVECRLHSGRTHQIRVHMASIGCSLVGDPVYGRSPKALQTKSYAALKQLLETHQQQALHAYQLEFIHPITGALCQFEAPLPPYMTQIRKILREVFTLEG